MDEETRLRQKLADLYREYQDRAKPIIDALVKIESLKPPKPIIFDPNSPEADRILAMLREK